MLLVFSYNLSGDFTVMLLVFSYNLAGDFAVMLLVISYNLSGDYTVMLLLAPHYNDVSGSNDITRISFSGNLHIIL